ncbi:MAG: YdcF family protein [Clostridia bacterium]|nr:YdcF family protein [Clostridia bacterium]
MNNILKYIFIAILIIIIIAIAINYFVIFSAKKRIVSKETTKQIEDLDCILILGAGVRGDQPSPMLEDRLLEGIDLYNQGVANKILVSGDHGTKGYDEVNVMKKFVIEHGVPSEDIFMDHAGFSTYDSIYRAKEIFKVEKMIVVTQEYHLYRALYVAKVIGIDAYGVASNPREYVGQPIRDIREFLARNKEFLKCIVKPKPKYLGEAIPVSGNGNATNDEVNV